MGNFSFTNLTHFFFKDFYETSFLYFSYFNKPYFCSHTRIYFPSEPAQALTNRIELPIVFGADLAHRRFKKRK